MRILHATSELHPFSKTGGLADMVASLAKAQAAEGHEVLVVTPLYRGIRDKWKLKRLDYELDQPLAGDWFHADLWELKPAKNLRILFVDRRSYFDRATVYGEKSGPYPDNAARFIYFSKCVVNIARWFPARPDIVHVHDWPTGMVPLLIRHQAGRDGWLNPPATVLSIHNLAYQGRFSRAEYPLTNLPWEYFHPDGVEFFGDANPLKAAILYADRVTTVSPRYAEEILTPEFGCGLEGVLAKRADALSGILNGVDYSEWTTKSNPHLTTSYDIKDLSGKAAQKAFLQKEMGLEPGADTPVMGVVGRLADQKGLDILLPALENIIEENVQIVQLGSGERLYEEAMQALAARHPSKLAARAGYDEGLAHRIEAGSDFFIMPSRYEPCGLNQMYSLRYGTIPIVRATGGLEDSVVDIREDETGANGIKFRDYSAAALTKALRKALALYAQPEWMRFYRENGMKADHSWKRTCGEYERVYQSVAKPDDSTKTAAS